MELSRRTPTRAPSASARSAASCPPALDPPPPGGADWDMGRNKNFRKRLATLEARLIDHCLKRQSEEAKPQPDEGTLAYWHKEIRGRLTEKCPIATR